MVLNISVQYNGGFPSDIVLLTQGYPCSELPTKCIWITGKV